jgi:hypothetical protein
MSGAVDNGDNLIEILSTAFSNTYFNTLYAEARDSFNDERYKTMEMAYRSTVETYANAFKQTRKIHGRENEHYPKIMGAICQLYNRYLQVNLTYQTFMETLAQTFIAPDIYAEMQTDPVTKANIVRTILIKTVSEFTVYVLTEQFSNAISLEIRSDSNKDPNKQKLRDAATAWKGKFKEIIRRQISEYNRLIIAKKNGVDLSAPQSDMIHLAVLKRMEEKLAETINAKALLTMRYNKVVQYCRQLIDHIKTLEETINAAKPILHVRPQPRPKPIVVPQQPQQPQQPMQHQPQQPMQHQPQQPIQQLEPQRPATVDISSLQAVKNMQNLDYTGETVLSPEQANLLDPANLEEIDTQADDLFETTEVLSDVELDDTSDMIADD